MKTILLIIWFLVFGLPAGLLSADAPQKETPIPQPSKEDLEIIKMLETLKLMDIMKNYDLVNNMEILIEEDTHEDNN